MSFTPPTSSLILLLVVLTLVLAVTVRQFVRPSESPLAASSNHAGSSRGSLPKSESVSGKAFDRFFQIWLENTDFSVANSTAAFNQLATQGIHLDQNYVVTPPSRAKPRRVRRR